MGEVASWDSACARVPEVHTHDLIVALSNSGISAGTDLGQSGVATEFQSPFVAAIIFQLQEHRKQRS